MDLNSLLVDQPIPGDITLLESIPYLMDPNNLGLPPGLPPLNIRIRFLVQEPDISPEWVEPPGDTTWGDFRHYVANGIGRIKVEIDDGSGGIVLEDA